MRLYNNYNTKKGDYFITIDDLYEPSNGIRKDTECVIINIEDEYIYFVTTEARYSGSFHIRSQNAEMCSLLTKKNRDKKIKDLLNV